jgi:hypothetical protein
MAKSNQSVANTLGYELLVTEPFADYVKGQIIVADDEINAILASENQGHVVKKALHVAEDSAE